MFKKLFLNDKFILGLILINSFILFLNGYLTPTTRSHFTLLVFDNLITFLFIIEVFIKTKHFGIRGYFKSNWNLFDFILVILSIPALITFAFNIHFLDFSFLLVFRVLRVFKAFRFFKFIPNIEQLMAGIQKALKASVFVFTGFIIYIFIIGIFSFYLFQDSESTYFENPLISLYSTFKIFTIEGWFEIPEQVVQNYNDTATLFTYIYFVFVVLTGGIFGLSIVNSIFVDTMVSDNNNDLEQKIDILDSKISELLTKTNQNETRKDT